MEISVSLLEGQKQSAKFGDLEVISDQSISAGGGAEHPEPFDYFLVSMVLCAGFYARKFCEQRDISTEGMTLTQNNENGPGPRDDCGPSGTPRPPARPAERLPPRLPAREAAALPGP